MPTIRSTATSTARLLATTVVLACVIAGCTSPAVVTGTPTLAPASPTGEASPTGASPTTGAPDETGEPTGEATGAPTDGDETPVPTAVPLDSWSVNATGLRDRVGQEVTFQCSPDGVPRTVWGTDVYTDDSSVCTAAVHAGAITLEEGGTVTIEIVEGQDEYTGSERNGITSQGYGSWGGSFSVSSDD